LGRFIEEDGKLRSEVMGQNRVLAFTISSATAHQQTWGLDLMDQESAFLFRAVGSISDPMG
jgi:hypothetical protein